MLVDPYALDGWLIPAGLVLWLAGPMVGEIVKRWTRVRP